MPNKLFLRQPPSRNDHELGNLVAVFSDNLAHSQVVRPKGRPTHLQPRPAIELKFSDKHVLSALFRFSKTTSLNVLCPPGTIAGSRFVGRQPLHPGNEPVGSLHRGLHRCARRRQTAAFFNAGTLPSLQHPLGFHSSKPHEKLRMKLVPRHSLKVWRCLYETGQSCLSDHRSKVDRQTCFGLSVICRFVYALCRSYALDAPSVGEELRFTKRISSSSFASCCHCRLGHAPRHVTRPGKTAVAYPRGIGKLLRHFS